MSRKQKTIAAIDVETDPFLYGRKPEPFILGFYDGDQYQEFLGDDCVQQFIEWLREQKTEYLIYAHNGGKFDFFYFLQQFEPKLKIINGRIAKAALGNHEFRDSYLILPLPLKAHKKDDFDYRILEKEHRYKPDNLKKIKLYLLHDCEYLYEWVKKFTDRFGRKLTLASAAFDQLKKTGYDIPKGRESLDAKFRPFYFGGRVEAMQPGSHYGEFEYYDLNSAYPDAMMTRHPYGMAFYQVGVLPKDGPYFATIRARSWGALPMRAEDGSLFFPRDGLEREYHATGWEIRAGLETQTLEILDVLECYKFEFNLAFVEYVEKFFREKAEGKRLGDKDMELFAKLMLNACYGKFGMDPSKFKEYYLCEYGELPGNPETDDELEQAMEEWSMVSSENGFAIYERDDPGDSYYNVATAASITGYVRANLWRAICASENPIYCDTDSLMCSVFHGDKGEALGQWSLEAPLDQIHVAGKKLYAARIAIKNFDGENESERWKTASKGARLTYDQIIRIAQGETVTWKKDAPAFSLRYGARFIERNIKKV